MHGLYVTAHAVNVALHENGRDRVDDARESGRRVQLAMHHSPYAVAPTGVWIDRISACENTARSYLTGRFAHALAGEAIPPVDDPGRLAQPWRLGHPIPPRTSLATSPRPTSSSSPAPKASSPAAAWRSSTRPRPPASSTPGPPRPRNSQSRPLLEQPSQPLGRPRSSRAPASRSPWPARPRKSAPPTARSPMTRPRSRRPEVIATRPGLSAATVATLRAIEASSELAHVVAEKAFTRDLTGPARALSRPRAERRRVRPWHARAPEGDVVWVSPADILADRTVPCRHQC